MRVATVDLRHDIVIKLNINICALLMFCASSIAASIDDDCLQLNFRLSSCSIHSFMIYNLGIRI